MKFGMERSQKQSTSEYSEASATFSMIERILGSLTLEVMKVSSLGILLVAGHTEFTTREKRQ